VSVAPPTGGASAEEVTPKVILWRAIPFWRWPKRLFGANIQGFAVSRMPHAISPVHAPQAQRSRQRL
jgi:hypothetical protein